MRFTKRIDLRVTKAAQTRVFPCYSRNFPEVTFSLLYDELLLC